MISKTYGALGLSKKTCKVEELGSKRPVETRCRWKIAWKELSVSLNLDPGVSGSTALFGGGSKDCRYVDNSDDLDISVFIVVLCVVMEVSNETMTLAGSTLQEGGDERRVGSKGGCGGDAGRLTGRAGTGGNESRTFKAGRLGLEVLVVDDPELCIRSTGSVNGAGGGGRVGREGVAVLGVSSSSSSGIGGSGGLFERNELE